MTKKKLAPPTWTTIRCRLEDLEEWEKNPAKISEENARELLESIEHFGFVIPFVAAAPPNGSKRIPLADGHQRKLVSLQLAKLGPGTLVDTRIPSRPLTEEERKELSIRLRKNVGEFDPEALRAWFESDDLLSYGFKAWELEAIGFDMEEALDYEEEWGGMPEFGNKEKAVKSLYVHFKTEKDYLDFQDLIGRPLTDKTKFIWYPEPLKRKKKGLEFINES